MKSYVAIVHKEKKSDYGVSFPDFPGCITAGLTMDEAYIMAQEVLNFHAQAMINDGEKLPKPSSLEVIINNAPEKDSIHAYFTVAFKETKQLVRINATFDPDLLAQIDKTVAKQKNNPLRLAGWISKPRTVLSTVIILCGYTHLDKYPFLCYI